MARSPRPEPLAWVVQTKLHPPQPRPDAVARPRLLDALCQGLTGHRLTLVSAPAGYGKTTLLAALPQTLPDVPVAWLALDPDDDDPARFLAGLIATLRRLEPSCGETTVALLANLTDPAQEMRRILGILVNDLVAAFERPVALVL